MTRSYETTARRRNVPIAHVNLFRRRDYRVGNRKDEGGKSKKIKTTSEEDRRRRGEIGTRE
jgi:hypothetical protein